MDYKSVNMNYSILSRSKWTMKSVNMNHFQVAGHPKVVLSLQNPNGQTDFQNSNTSELVKAHLKCLYPNSVFFQILPAQFFF